MKFNIHFFVILIIASVVSFADILIYAFKLNYWLAIAISFAIATCIIFANRKKIKLKTDFNKFDFIFFGILLINFVHKIVKADQEWDTCNYHIYLQENPFIDKINFDFLPGKIVNSFLFPLGDRIYYLFRKILGYRLGVVPSFYAIVVLYYQAKKLIKDVCNTDKEILVSILANMSYLVYIIFSLVGTYYIDIFSVIFIIEIIYLSCSTNNFIKEKSILYLSFLISGLAVGIKISNIVPIFVTYVYILIKNFKNLKDIKIKDFPICMILFLFPFIVYAYDNFIQTDSFLFPLLKSNVFGEFEWRDTRFGIPNILYSFIWPFVIIFNPKRGYDIDCYDFVWPIGYLIVILYIIYALIKHKKIKEDKTYQMSVFAFVMTIMWTIFLMAYTRYASFLTTLYITVFASLVLKVNNLKIEKMKKIMIYVIAFLTSIVMSSVTLIYILNNIKNLNLFVKMYNKIGIFNDVKQEKIHIDGAWLVVANDSRIATLVREEGTPIYNLETEDLKTENTLKMQQKLREKVLYILVDDNYAAKKINTLTEYNFEIVQIYKKDLQLNFLSPYNKVNIYKVRYNENTEDVIKTNLEYFKQYQ